MLYCFTKTVHGLFFSIRNQDANRVRVNQLGGGVMSMLLTHSFGTWLAEANDDGSED